MNVSLKELIAKVLTYIKERDEFTSYFTDSFTLTQGGGTPSGQLWIKYNSKKVIINGVINISSATANTTPILTASVPQAIQAFNIQSAGMVKYYNSQTNQAFDRAYVICDGNGEVTIGANWYTGIPLAGYTQITIYPTTIPQGFSI